MLKKFRPSQWLAAARQFQEMGAIIWDEPLFESYKEPDDWQCKHSTVSLKRINESDRPLVTVSKEFGQCLKKLFTEAPHNPVPRGCLGPDLRRLEAFEDETSACFRPWHLDSWNTITLIVPLVPFTIYNGGTLLMLPKTHIPIGSYDVKPLPQRVVQFTGEPYIPLVMNGLVLHSQAPNKTFQHRDAVVLSLDRGIF